MTDQHHRRPERWPQQSRRRFVANALVILLAGPCVGALFFGGFWVAGQMDPADVPNHCRAFIALGGIVSVLVSAGYLVTCLLRPTH